MIICDHCGEKASHNGCHVFFKDAAAGGKDEDLGRFDLCPKCADNLKAAVKNQVDTWAKDARDTVKMRWQNQREAEHTRHLHEGQSPPGPNLPKQEEFGPSAVQAPRHGHVEQSPDAPQAPEVAKSHEPPKSLAEQQREGKKK